MAICVNPITIRRAYNRPENWYHESRTVLGENVYGFVVEDIFRASDYTTGLYRHLYQSLQYGLPRSLFFDVPSLEKIPQAADFHISCPELDEVFGFAAETERRLKDLRTICQQRWDDHLKELKEKLTQTA